ncbi:MAG: Transcriptional regulator [Oscillospiraceae bacterium]|nr:Transcriptional regulator [Oscillospiraceae bacterium]
MLVAEEMSISRAALRACVTQQCVSDHIKRLEQQHNVKLFTRRPRFQLTEAGQTMLRALRNMQAMERAMNDNLKRWAQGTKGHLMLGIGTSRARAILPMVLPDYAQQFPEVEIDVVMDDTVVLAEKLRQGKVDLFIGVNPAHDEDFDFEPVCDDEICLIISEKLLRSAFPGNFQEILQKKVDLAQWSHVPFSQNFSTSTASKMLIAYLDRSHTTLKIPYRISDTETQISLCAAGMCAAFCPRMLLPSVRKHNLHCPPDQLIHVISIKGFHERLSIEAVSLKSAEVPNYIVEFTRILRHKVFESVYGGETQGSLSIMSALTSIASANPSDQYK